MARDAAAADIGVEQRHVAARAMLDRYRGHQALEEVVELALAVMSARCLDDDDDRAAVTREVVRAIRDSTDARFVRELLGADPGDRMTRLHAHGALLGRATDAAWRLAGGDYTDSGEIAAERTGQ